MHCSEQMDAVKIDKLEICQLDMCENIGWDQALL